MLTAGAGTATVDVPEVGELVRLRGQQWVVSHRRDSTQPRDELATSQPPGAPCSPSAASATTTWATS